MSEYIGSRIVPKPCGEWDNTNEYDVLSVVLYSESGDSYIARKNVPAGTAITEVGYWMLCSKFSAQLAALKTYLTDMETGMDKKVSDAIAEIEDARVSNADTAYDSIGSHIRAIETGVALDAGSVLSAILTDGAVTAEKLSSDVTESHNKVLKRLDAIEEVLVGVSYNGGEESLTVTAGV